MPSITNAPSSCKIPIGRFRTLHTFPNTKRSRTQTQLFGHSMSAINRNCEYMQVDPKRLENRAAKIAANEAKLPEFRPFSDADDEPDRDECVWRCPSEDEPELPPPKEMDRIFETVSMQYDGVITMDGVLHRLMEDDFKVDKMLENIEQERDRLPQQFYPFSCVQQTLFNQAKSFGKPNFSLMQKNFLSEYHLGEIITYYYRTKRRCFFLSLNDVYKTVDKKVYEVEVEGPSQFIVDRIDCKYCTNNHTNKTLRVCRVCSLYESKFNRTRPASSLWTDEELAVLKKWDEMKQETGIDYSLFQVRTRMEEERIANLKARHLTAEEILLIQRASFEEQRTPIKLLSPFRFHFVTRQMSLQNWREFENKVYDQDEVAELIFQTERFGRNPQKISAVMNIPEMEIICFYHRFKKEYDLKKVIERFHTEQTGLVAEVDLPIEELESFKLETPSKDPTKTPNKTPRKRNMIDEPSTSRPQRNVRRRLGQ